MLNKSEDGIITMIRKILKELSVEMKGKIWKCYNEVKYRFEDDYGISDYINQYSSQPSINSYHASFQNNYTPYQPLYKGTSSSFQSDNDLRVINEFLSKEKTFKEGIRKLKEYREKNKSFNILKYFKQMNYSSNFIELVQSELEKESNERQLESRDNLSANINEKLKQLKMRFDGMNGQKVHG